MQRGLTFRNASLALVLTLSFCALSFAQNADQNGSAPLGDIAKNNKSVSKDKAKRNFTNEDFSIRHSPIPAVALLGPDNFDQIINTLHDFKATHTAAETEQVLHQWFDEQNEVLSSAIDASTKAAQHYQLKMETAQDTPYVYDGDPTKLQQRQISERLSQRSDARNSRDNQQVVGRIQQAFMRVRCDAVLNRGRMAYDWFRIRNANGVGSY